MLSVATKTHSTILKEISNTDFFPVRTFLRLQIWISDMYFKVLVAESYSVLGNASKLGTHIQDWNWFLIDSTKIKWLLQNWLAPLQDYFPYLGNGIKVSFTWGATSRLPDSAQNTTTVILVPWQSWLSRQFSIGLPMFFLKDVKT